MRGLSSVLLVLSSVFALATSHACPDDPAPPNANYTLVLSVPTGCTRGQCYFYVAMRLSDENQEFIDFQMEGKATGYIAIGFGNQKSQMYDSDVFACAVNPTTGMVEAFDTYNTAGETWNNIRDTDVNRTQSRNVCPRVGSLSFINGTISCSFSRAVDIFNTLEDKRLDDFYYIQMAYTNKQPVINSNGLLTLVDHGHDHPMVTPMQYNAFTSESRSAPQSSARSNLVACWEFAAASIALSYLLLSLM